MLPKAHVLFACLMVLPSHLLLMMGVYFRNESICECARGGGIGRRRRQTTGFSLALQVVSCHMWCRVSKLELAAGEIYCQSPLIRALMHELELLRESY